MNHRLPSHDELVDLSWLLDSALACGHRARAVDFANRLLDSLVRQRDGMARSRVVGGATTAARHDAWTGLVADVSAVLSCLHRDDRVGRVEFRHRVEALQSA